MKLWRWIWLPVLIALIVVGGCKKTETVMPESSSVTPPPAANPPKAVSPTAPGDSAKLSLYVMSECPYGTPAEKVVQTVRKVLKNRLAVRIVFIIGQEAGGELSSLHGPTEVEKDKIQACVGKLAADKQLDFIVRMNDLQGDWKKAAAEFNLDPSAIDQCVNTEAKQLLLAQFQETQTLKVDASPTFILNGGSYSGGSNSRDVFDAACATFAPGDAPPECASPPDTLSRTDGHAAGSCGGNASEPPMPPEAVDNTVFEHTIVWDPNALSTDRMDEVLAQTRKIFPKMQIKKIDANSREGKKLVEKYKLTQLPAYLFPGAMSGYKNFKMMERYLKKVDDAYVLDPGIGGNIFVARERKPKVVDIFYSPFSAKAMRVLLDVHDHHGRAHRPGHRVGNVVKF